MPISRGGQDCLMPAGPLFPVVFRCTIHVHVRTWRCTIRIDLDAYERLRSVRRDKESFSQTIKRIVKPPIDYAAFRKRLESLSLSKKAAETIEEQIRDRRPSNRSSEVFTSPRVDCRG